MDDLNKEIKNAEQEKIEGVYTPNYQVVPEETQTEIPKDDINILTQKPTVENQPIKQAVEDTGNQSTVVSENKKTQESTFYGSEQYGKAPQYDQPMYEDRCKSQTGGFGQPPMGNSQTNSYGDNGNRQNSYGGYQQSAPYQPSQYNTTTGFEHGGGEEPYKWNLNDYQQPQERSPKRKKSNGLAVFAAIIAVLFSFCLIIFAGFGIYSIATKDGAIIDSNSSQAITTPSETLPNISIQNKPDIVETKSPDGRLTAVEIARKVKPSVVCIQNYKGTGYGASGEGSGIIMTADGYILTNAHVVEGAKGIKVILDNEEVYQGEVVGTDVQTDLAVVKIEAQNLAYVEFGNSDQLEVGEKVLAIGNSAGLSGTVTQGIVSAKDRTMRSEVGYDMSFIQVDATINPGNSGGALVNEFGQVIGINSAKLVSTDVEGIGFAIPINEAMPIIDDLIKYKRVTGRAKLGIEGIAIDTIDSKMYGIPIGVQIINIQPGSDLEGKNIVTGDIITKMNDETITSFDDIKTVLTELKPGDGVTLTLYRPTNTNLPGKFFEVNIKLVEDK